MNPISLHQLKALLIIVPKSSLINIESRQCNAKETPYGPGNEAMVMQVQETRGRSWDKLKIHRDWNSPNNKNQQIQEIGGSKSTLEWSNWASEENYLVIDLFGQISCCKHFNK